MLSSIILCMIVYQLNMATWCKVIAWLGITVNTTKCLVGIYKAGMEDSNNGNM